MVDVVAAVESLPWSSLEIPLPYQRAAGELGARLGEADVRILARGFHENNACLVAITDDALHVSVATAFRARSERWQVDRMDAIVAQDADRHVLELVRPGQRTVLRLMDEQPSRDLVDALERRLRPTPEITFRPYTPRA